MTKLNAFKYHTKTLSVFRYRYSSLSMMKMTYKPMSTFNNNSNIFDDSEKAAMADAKDALNSIDEAVITLKSYNDWVPVVMKSKIPVILD